MKDDFVNFDLTPRSGKKMILVFMGGSWAYPFEMDSYESNDFLVLWIDESMTDQHIDDYVRSICLDDISN